MNIYWLSSGLILPPYIVPNQIGIAPLALVVSKRHMDLSCKQEVIEGNPLEKIRESKEWGIFVQLNIEKSLCLEWYGKSNLSYSS
jgi:hypothetical protein